MRIYLFREPMRAHTCVEFPTTLDGCMRLLSQLLNSEGHPLLVWLQPSQSCMDQAALLDILFLLQLVPLCISFAGFDVPNIYIHCIQIIKI